MIRRLTVVLLVVPLVGNAAATAPAASTEDPAKHWRFAVLLDGKRIGEHDFAVVRHADEVDVDIQAHFKVRMAFIPLYGYDHQDREVWTRGCLARIDSQTADGGKKLTVHGSMQGDAFAVEGSHGDARLPSCVKSFAYWDQSFLTEPRLLNSQTGEYESVNLTRHGVENVQVSGHTVAAQHYSLRAAHFGIDLWYSSQGEWLSLESRLENGRTLRYEMQ